MKINVWLPRYRGRSVGSLCFHVEENSQSRSEPTCTTSMGLKKGCCGYCSRMNVTVLRYYDNVAFYSLVPACVKNRSPDWICKSCDEKCRQHVEAPFRYRDTLSDGIFLHLKYVLLRTRYRKGASRLWLTLSVFHAASTDSESSDDEMDLEIDSTASTGSFGRPRQSYRNLVNKNRVQRELLVEIKKHGELWFSCCRWVWSLISCLAYGNNDDVNELLRDCLVRCCPDDFLSMKLYNEVLESISFLFDCWTTNKFTQAEVFEFMVVIDDLLTVQ